MSDRVATLSFGSFASLVNMLSWYECERSKGSEAELSKSSQFTATRVTGATVKVCAHTGGMEGRGSRTRFLDLFLVRPARLSAPWSPAE